MPKDSRDLAYAAGALGVATLAVYLVQRNRQLTAAEIIAQAKRELDPLRTPVVLP
jgi:hypothetical protein